MKSSRLWQVTTKPNKLLCNLYKTRGDYRESGICKRSRKAVHWLKTMLLEPDERRFSSSLNRVETFEDSTQFFSISIWNRLEVGAVIRSFLVTVFLCNWKDVIMFSLNIDFLHTWNKIIIYLQTGQRPDVRDCQLANKHSRHIRWAHGVSTASSKASRHIGHSPSSPFRNSSTTSWT